nr:hypothetical protein [Hyalangium versicolor]
MLLIEELGERGIELFGVPVVERLDNFTPSVLGLTREDDRSCTRRSFFVANWGRSDHAHQTLHEEEVLLVLSPGVKGLRVVQSDRSRRVLVPASERIKERRGSAGQKGLFVSLRQRVQVRVTAHGQEVVEALRGAVEQHFADTSTPEGAAHLQDIGMCRDSIQHGGEYLMGFDQGILGEDRQKLGSHVPSWNQSTLA